MVGPGIEPLMVMTDREMPSGERVASLRVR